jgi:hypothetical protein
VSRRAAVVIVHGPDHIEAAFAAAESQACALDLLVAGWAGAAYGPLYLAEAVAQARARHPGAEVRVALDCADDAGLAMAALRCGWRRLVLAGRADVRARIAGMAEAAGAALVDPYRADALDLADESEPGAALARRLADCK